MKIIQVCQRYYPDIGGIETHVREISEVLVKKGFEVEVVCTDASGKLPKHEVINGVKVTRFWTFSPKDNFFFSPAMYFYLRRQKYDVIHAHNYHSFPAFFAALANKKRFIFTPHSSGFSKSLIKRIFYKLYKPFGSYIFNSADKIISITQNEKEMLIKTFNIPLNRIIYLSLPIKLVTDSKDRKDRNVINIAFFGRLSPEKNIGALISAFELVRKQYPDCDLLIAGDGPSRKELENIGKNIEGVHFVGPIFKDDLINFINNIDIFVLPSRYEVSPRAIIEAMSRGVPVITTPVGELPQIFQHGKNCLFTKIDDPKDTAWKMIQLMSDKNLANEIGLAGKALVEERYDIDKIIERYIQIYTVADR